MLRPKGDRQAHLHGALLLFTLLPCGMPTSEGDRSLLTVMGEIEAQADAGSMGTLTPEQIEAINAQNEALFRSAIAAAELIGDRPQPSSESNR